MAKPFNGHRSWNAWNVSLWINNDESLYRLAQWCISRCSTKEGATECMVEQLAAEGVRNTPDGGRYNKTAVRLAMRGM